MQDFLRDLASWETDIHKKDQELLKGGDVIGGTGGEKGKGKGDSQRKRAKKKKVCTARCCVASVPA